MRICCEVHCDEFVTRMKSGRDDEYEYGNGHFEWGIKAHSDSELELRMWHLPGGRCEGYEH